MCVIFNFGNGDAESLTRNLTRNSCSFMKFIFLLIQLLYAQENNEKQPNIIFVLADDLGWADVNWNNKDSSPQYSLKLTFKLFKSNMT